MLVNRNKKADKTNPVYNERLEMAKNITRLATGSDTCLEAPIRIARRFTLEQLRDIDFLLNAMLSN